MFLRYSSESSVFYEALQVPIRHLYYELCPSCSEGESSSIVGESSFFGPPKVMGLLKWWATSNGGPQTSFLMPNLCLGAHKLYEISFPDLTFYLYSTYKKGPLAHQGPGLWTCWPHCKSNPRRAGGKGRIRRFVHKDTRRRSCKDDY